eukprot:12983714-Alexandrium_andersonii.AAC.1
MTRNLAALVVAAAGMAVAALVTMGAGSGGRPPLPSAGRRRGPPTNLAAAWLPAASRVGYT